MRFLPITILLLAMPFACLAEEFDAATEASSQYQEKAASGSGLEEIKQNLDKLKEQLQGVSDTQDQLGLERDKLIQAVIVANETATIKLLKVIFEALESYRQEQTLTKYPKDFADLTKQLPEKVLRATDSSCAIYGYYYEYKYVNKRRFHLKAIPEIQSQAGQRTFLMDETGVIINAQTGKLVILEEENEGG